jgi:putative glycosyltransferase (TIGR04372 family)
MIFSQNSPMIFFKKANKLKQEGLLEEAVIAYQSAIAENPNFYWSYHNLGETLVKLDRPYEAVTYYQRALELNPNSTVSHHNLGDIYRVLDHLDVAIVEYQQALKYSPNNYSLYNKLGQTLCQLSALLNPEYLLENFLLSEQIREILPESSYLYGYPGELYYLKDEDFLKETDLLSNDCFLEEAYRTYLKRKPDEDGKEHYLYHLQHGLTRQEIISAFRQSPEFNSLLVFLIKSIYLQVAIAVCRHSIALNPNYKQSYETLIELGLLWGNVLTQQGKLDEAIESYKQVLAVDRNNLSLNNLKLGEAHYQLAYALSQNKKVDEGIESYRQAIALRPDWADPHLMLAGVLLYQDDRFDEAIEMYERAIALRPDWAEAYLMVGNAMLYQDKLEKAIERYEQAIALRPDWEQPYRDLGDVLFKQNKLEQAIEKYEQAIALAPEWDYAHYSLGNTFLQQGRYEKALSCHLTALILNPNWNEDAYFSLGFHVYSQEHLEGIKKIYQQALTLKSNWTRGYKAAGSWLMNLLGQLNAALEFWHEHKTRQQEPNILTFYGFDLTRNIGHIALLDILVKLQHLGWVNSPQEKFIWAPPQQFVANRCLLNYWHQYIPVISDSSLPPLKSPWMRYEEEFIGLLALSNGQTMYMHHIAANVQKQWEAERHPPLLSLSDFDSERGWQCLQALGIPTDAWFVCLHVREPGFYKQRNSNLSARDCDIDTYLLAIQTIVSRGGWVIRLGDPSMKPLPKIPQVIDYPHTKFKSDWMDVFLCAKCHFFVGTNSGLCAVATNFGVPVILTNLPHLGYLPWFGIWIPKLYWYEKEKCYINFSERLIPPLGYIDLIRMLSSIGIQVVDNTPEEINDIVIEMLELLDGTIKYTEEDKKLQQQFEGLVKKYAGYDCNSRMGRAFSKKYDYLLYENSQKSFLVETHKKAKSGQVKLVSKAITGH